MAWGRGREQRSGDKPFPGISFPFSVSFLAKGSFKERSRGAKGAGLCGWHGSKQQPGQKLDPARPWGVAGVRNPSTPQVAPGLALTLATLTGLPCSLTGVVGLALAAPGPPPRSAPQLPDSECGLSRA